MLIEGDWRVAGKIFFGLGLVSVVLPLRLFLVVVVVGEGDGLFAAPLVE